MSRYLTDGQRPGGHHNQYQRLSCFRDFHHQLILCPGQVEASPAVGLTCKYRLLSYKDNGHIGRPGCINRIRETFPVLRSGSGQAPGVIYPIGTQHILQGLKGCNAEVRITVEDPCSQLFISVVGHGANHRNFQEFFSQRQRFMLILEQYQALDSSSFCHFQVFHGRGQDKFFGIGIRMAE